MTQEAKKRPDKRSKGQPGSSAAQVDKFKEAARELECDDDEGRFRARFKKLTEAPPPESVESRKTIKRTKPRS